MPERLSATARRRSPVAAPRRPKVLRLTNRGYWQAGSAWAPAPIDPHQSLTTTFEVSFPDGNHVAVMVNGHPEKHLVSAPVPFPMFGTPFAATVAYDAPSTTLSVWVHPIGKAG